jgi:amphi-Trp domain-containing protein
MKETIDKELTRDDLAEHLIALADQLRKGGLTMEERTWTVPDALNVRIRVKEKKDVFPTACPASGQRLVVTTWLSGIKWISGNYP